MARNVSRSEIVSAIVEDLEDKKTYTAKFDTKCSLCTNSIPAGDEFVYLGGKKVDLDCRDYAVEVAGGI